MSFFALVAIAMLIAFNIYAVDAMVKLREDVKVVRKIVSDKYIPVVKKEDSKNEDSKNEDSKKEDSKKEDSKK